MTFVGRLGDKKHRTLHYIDTDEAMVKSLACPSFRPSLIFIFDVAGQRLQRGYRRKATQAQGLSRSAQLRHCQSH
jgi:hypothetical protein